MQRKRFTWIYILDEPYKEVDSGLWSRYLSKFKGVKSFDEAESLYVQIAEKIAFSYCIYLLSKRDYHSLELQTKMQLKRLPLAAISLTISRLREINYLDDDRFIKSFIYSDLRSFRGPRKIIARLTQKLGISSYAAEQLLSEQTSPEDEQNTVIQYLKAKPSLRKKASQSLIKHLVNKGFNYETIKLFIK